MKKAYVPPEIVFYGNCDYCISCGAPVPEGTWYCPVCENK